MTPADVITEVKRLIQDNPLMRTPDTHIAATLLNFTNSVLKRIVAFRPEEYMYYDAAYAPTASSSYQVLPATGVRIGEIFSSVVATVPAAIMEVDRDSLDRSTPGWTAETAGTPVNWCRHPRNPRVFFLYPAPAAGVTLRLEYVKAPSVLAVGDTIALLPDNFLPIIVDGVAYMAESVYNGGDPGRSKMFYEGFMQGLKATAMTRSNVDDEFAAVEGTRKP